MKATIKTALGTFEVEGDSQVELWKAIASTQEVFNESKCGLCGCNSIQVVVRKNKDGDEFCEYRCLGFLESKQACRAYLYLGQNKKGGGLFPVRALDEKGKPDRENGKFGKHRGWTRYRGEAKEESK